MPNLVFFSRVALLCNACFLVAFLMHYIPGIRNGIVPSTVIILGNVVAIVLNTLLNIILVSLLISRKLAGSGIPRWLALTNFVFFVFQVILLVK